MKTILIGFALYLFSSPLQAGDQLQILSEARDHHLKLAMKALRDHCPFLDLYVCRVRLESDCTEGIDKEKICSLLRGIEEAEERFIQSDKQISQDDIVLCGEESTFCKEDNECKVVFTANPGCPQGKQEMRVFSTRPRPKQEMTDRSTSSLKLLECGTSNGVKGAICVNQRCHPNRINVGF